MLGLHSEALLYVQDYSGMSMLEHCLLRKFAGPLPVVAVITSFLSFSRNVVCGQVLSSTHLHMEPFSLFLRDMMSPIYC